MTLEEERHIADPRVQAKLFLKDNTQPWPPECRPRTRKNWLQLAKDWSTNESRSIIVEALKVLRIPATSYARMQPDARAKLIILIQDVLVGDDAAVRKYARRQSRRKPKNPTLLERVSRLEGEKLKYIAELGTLKRAHEDRLTELYAATSKAQERQLFAGMRLMMDVMQYNKARLPSVSELVPYVDVGLLECNDETKRIYALSVLAEIQKRDNGK